MLQGAEQPCSTWQHDEEAPFCKAGYGVRSQDLECQGSSRDELKSSSCSTQVRAFVSL